VLAVPTPDHYLPLLYVIGARQKGDAVTFPVGGVDGGSISMLAVRVGCPRMEGPPPQVKLGIHTQCYPRGSQLAPLLDPQEPGRLEEFCKSLILGRIKAGTTVQFSKLKGILGVQPSRSNQPRSKSQIARFQSAGGILDRRIFSGDLFALKTCRE